MSQTDLRIVRSKKMIKEAFINLVEDKGYENITIKDISEGAMINRKTFYSHYESVNALFLDILKEHVDVLVENFRYDYVAEEGQTNIEAVTKEMRMIIEHISSHKRSIKILLNDSSSYQLTKQLESLMQERLMSKIALINKKRKVSKIPVELLTATITSVFIVVIKWWLSSEAYSEEEVSQMFIELVSSKLI